VKGARREVEMQEEQLGMIKAKNQENEKRIEELIH
jgi:hypothetical protein